MVQLLLATAERSRTAIRAPLLIARGIVHDANGRLPPRAMFDTIACSEPAAPTPMSTRALVLVAAVAMPVCPRNTSRPDTGNVVAACIWIQLPAVFAVPPAVTVVSSDDATSWPPISCCPASDRYQTAIRTGPPPGRSTDTGTGPAFARPGSASRWSPPRIATPTRRRGGGGARGGGGGGGAGRARRGA